MHMRVVFMGTPDFAVPCLEALLKAGHNVAAVVTQPDRPKGRGHQLAYSPVKEAALAAGIPVLQPLKVKDSEFIQELGEFQPEVIVVVAFGQILPTTILEMPPYGCVNVHASLLPKYRGAAPVHWVVLNGETKTGITTMLMDRGLDTGDMLLKSEINIAPEETVGSIHDRLADLGSTLLLDTLDALAAHKIKPTPQDHAQFSYAPMLERQDEKIDWTWDNGRVHNRIRGMNPWPGAYTTYQGKVVKLWTAKTLENSSNTVPGTIVNVDKNLGFTVQTGHGQILITEIQPQGSKKMPAAAFARGHAVTSGDKLGD